MPSDFSSTIERTELRELLGRVRGAGMNIVRLSGVAVYGDELLYRLCDELGLLVWQDFAFANMDYPSEDETFRLSVEAEAADFLEPVGRHRQPGCALWRLRGGAAGDDDGCGSGRGPRALCSTSCCRPRSSAAAVEVPYLRSTPTGGALPIKPGVGIAHYYGVGAYRRPLEDARRAGVRFAAECLGFSNVPDDDALLELGAGVAPAPQSPAWKRGVPRDGGASWDFEDIRDHYLRELYAVDPVALRSEDRERYVALSRAVTGVVMAETFGEWRREGSACGGALVWWLNDVLPGAGWGILDSRGRPKPAYWIVRRPLAPIAIWTTDEGTNGIAVHVANDTMDPVDAVIDVRLFRDAEQVIAQGQRGVQLAPRTTIEDDVESVLGRFADAGYAYRFGAPQHDVVSATLLVGGEMVAQAAHFPLGRRAQGEPVQQLGITAVARPDGDGGYSVELASRRVAEGVRVAATGFEADDAWLLLIPGFRSIVRLRPVGVTEGLGWQGGRVEVLNGGGGVEVECSEG